MTANDTNTCRPVRRGNPRRRPASAGRTWARERIRAAHAAAGRRIAVLDDDPTGSQTVHDVSVRHSFRSRRVCRRSGRTGVDLLHPDQHPQPARRHRRRTEHRNIR
jgi:hypothetical protein